ncbi:MAG TPA: hypothetical protein VF855_11810, partial [Acidimicrobiales bacterium]
VDALKTHLRSHAQPNGWSVCMHVGGVEATTASMVVELAAAGRSTAWCLLGSPCLSIYIPVVVGEPLGDVPAWERFAALDAGRRATLDELEARLAFERLPAAEAFAAVSALLPPA